MLVELATLKPNPYRDFTVDPIDPETVAQLTESMKEDGFWGGVVCRKGNGHIEIAAGHHRIQAALEAGYNVADLFVGDLDDLAMIRVYARENATQRGNSGTALAGSIASAIRFLAKAAITGTMSKFFDIPGEEEVRGNLMSDHGLGERVILRFLSEVPGISQNAVRQQIANLKASGDYARILGEVQADLEREEREAAAALARAEEEQRAAAAAAWEAEQERKAAVERARQAREAAARKQAELDRQRAEAQAELAEKRRREMDAEAQRLGIIKEQSRAASQTAKTASSKAAARPVTFDFEGVAKHLKNTTQINAFRDVATGQGVAPYLPVSQQAALARDLVAKAREQGREVSGAYIRENTMALVLAARATVRQLDEEEKRRGQETDLRLRFQQYEDDFMRGMRGLNNAGLKMLETMQANPKFNFQLSPNFKETITSAKNIIDRLYDRVTK